MERIAPCLLSLRRRRQPGLLLGLDLADHVAGLVDEPARSARDARVLAGAGVVARLEAPFLIDRVDRPEIALGARHAGRDLGADGRTRDPDRLGPDPDQARPEEAARAPRPPRDVLLAEARLGELDPALERVGVDQLRPAEVAQLEHVAVVEVELGLIGVGLDQDAAGPAVADVQHQVDVDRRVAALGRDRVEQLEPRRAKRLVEQLQERDVAGGVFERLAILRPQRAAALGGLELDEQFVDPAIDPFLIVHAALLVGQAAFFGQEPRDVTKEARKDKLMFGDRVLRAGRDVRTVWPSLDQLGVESQDDMMRMARRMVRLCQGHA